MTTQYGDAIRTAAIENVQAPPLPGSKTSISITALPGPNLKGNAAVAPFVEPESQTNDRRRSSHAPHWQITSSGAPHLPNSSNCFSTTHPLVPGVSLPKETDLNGRLVTSQEPRPSVPLPNVGLSTRQDEHRKLSGEANRLLSDVRNPTSLSTYCQPNPKNFKFPKGTNNPINKTSDDIRRQYTTAHAQCYPMHFNQNGWMVPVSFPNQIPFMQYPGHLSQIPNRTSSIGFKDATWLGTNFTSTIDLKAHNNAGGLKPFYPKPEAWCSRPASDHLPPQRTTHSEKTSKARILSNPFPSTVCESPEHKESVISSGDFRLQPPNRRRSDQGQDPYSHVEAFRANEHNSSSEQVQLDRAPSEHIDGDTNRSRGLFSPRLLAQMIPDHDECLETSSQTPLTAPISPNLPLSQMQQLGFEVSNGIYPGLVPFTQTENKAFPFRLTYGQPVTQEEQIRPGINNQSTQYHCQNSSGLQQEQLPAQRLSPPSDSSALFLSGLPSHIEAKALWDMLSSLRGLKWIASPRKSAMGKGYWFSKIV